MSPGQHRPVCRTSGSTLVSLPQGGGSELCSNIPPAHGGSAISSCPEPLCPLSCCSMKTLPVFCTAQLSPACQEMLLPLSRFFKERHPTTPRGDSDHHPHMACSFPVTQTEARIGWVGVRACPAITSDFLWPLSLPSPQLRC